MKKLACLIMLAAMLFTMTVCSDKAEKSAASAETAAPAATAEPTIYTCDGYEYIILEDGTAEICSADDPEGDIIIPSELNGIKVTSIGDRALDICLHLTSVTIPDSVTYIGDYAFFNCSSLTSVTIPDSVTYIGDYAFGDCGSLTSVTIPDSVVSMGANPFKWCIELTDIIVSSEHPVFATIDGVLFDKSEKKLICYPCAFDSRVYSIPDGVTSIGDSAFVYSYLTSVTIPDSVTHIGDSAFYNCALTSVTIPDSVVSMGANPFNECYELTDIIVSPDHPVFATIDGVLFNKSEKKLICYSCAFDSDVYSIPDGVTSIGDLAFYYCSSLTSVTIPDSVTSIGDLAFYYCSSLTSVTIPDSVTYIGDSAFWGCSSLTSVTIPDSVVSMGANPFSYCYNLSDIIVSPEQPVFATIDGVLFNKSKKKLICYPCALASDVYSIPDGITSIDDCAFCGCRSLSSVTIPDSVTSIGDSTFWFCDSLTSITIPDSVTSIGDSAFWSCDSLEFIVDRDSYAAEYAKADNIPYTYPDANDWLND